jgi:hypothetical protein
MNIKLSKLMLPFIALGALLIPVFQSMALASDGSGEQKQISTEKMHEHFKARLDKLANRLEIKSSQQAAWEEYAKSVESLAEHGAKRPAHDADAATISRIRADRATESAKKLTVIADATAKLQKALTEDQQKILNQVLRQHSQHRMSHRHNQGWHGCHQKHHGWDGKTHEKLSEGHK